MEQDPWETVSRSAEPFMDIPFFPAKEFI
jgi:hypothetical protein